jgi:hypothetical protein
LKTKRQKTRRAMTKGGGESEREKKRREVKMQAST